MGNLPPQLIAAIACAMALYLGAMQLVVGAKALGRDAKKAGVAIVHALKHLPHPTRHHDEEPQ